MFLGLKQDFGFDHATPIRQLDKKWSVVNQDNTFYLLSNVCPHQNSLITQCSTVGLTCPYHGLQYDLKGHGIDNKYQLAQQNCYSNGAMLFDSPVDYEFPVCTDHFELDTYRRDSVNANADVIMDVFLDIDHIPIAHAGVYDRVGITNVDHIKYKLFAGGSIQLVPAQDTSHMIDADKCLGIGACWMAVYPNTMIEWQPGALFVTVAHNKFVDVFQYRDQRYSQSAWRINQEVWELAWAQDKTLSQNIVSLASENLDQLKIHHRVNNAVQQ